MSTASASSTAPIDDVRDPEMAAARSIRSVYVYEAPLRLWHWVNALAIVVLAVTGYLIGAPLPTQPGEASAHFLMGYIRFAHFVAGYVLAVGLLGRIYWAVVGNHHARELFWIPIFQRSYWIQVWRMVKWYSFLGARPTSYIGHNPVARLAMFLVFLPTVLFMVVTGFALYAQGAQSGSWLDKLFGWVVPLMGQSQDVHTWHHIGMWVLICFVIVHIYTAIREDIMGPSSMVSTMVSGHRTFKD